MNVIINFIRDQDSMTQVTTFDVTTVYRVASPGPYSVLRLDSRLSAHLLVLSLFSLSPLTNSVTQSLSQCGDLTETHITVTHHS